MREGGSIGKMRQYGVKVTVWGGGEYVEIGGGGGSIGEREEAYRRGGNWGNGTI